MTQLNRIWSVSSIYFKRMHSQFVMSSTSSKEQLIVNWRVRCIFQENVFTVCHVEYLLIGHLLSYNWAPSLRFSYSLFLIIMATIKFRFSSTYASILSNLSVCHLPWKGQHFCSSEAAYQWEKAHFHGSPNIASIMESVRTGREAKQKSLRRTTSSWDDVKMDMLFHINLVKFEVCPEYRRMLKTGVTYTEDTNDLFWGRGPTGNGQNAMGLIHGLVAEMTLQILIIGSSHTRGLDQILRTQLTPATQKKHHIDTVTLPGATIQQLRENLPTDTAHYTHIIICIGSCNVTYKDTSIYKESPTAIIDQLNTLQQTVSEHTNGQVLLCDLPPKPNPQTPAQHAKSSPYNITGDTTKKYNRNIHYINSKLHKHISTPQLWKKSGSTRYGNIEHFSDDCLHLSVSGKTCLIENIVKSMTNL